MGYILQNEGVAATDEWDVNGLPFFFRASTTNTVHPKIDIQYQKHELICWDWGRQNREFL